MGHPAEIAAGIEKRGVGFMAVLPWLLMAAPFATQLIDKFRGVADIPAAAGGQNALKGFQLPKPPGGLGSTMREHTGVAPYFNRPALTRTAQGLHNYRTRL